MINAEKYKNKLRTFHESTGLFDCALRRDNGAFCNCSDINCKNCTFSDNNNEGCNHAFLEWMLSEYEEPPFKVSKLEYDLLDYLYNNTKFRYIARDEAEWLYAYYEPPVKGSDCWEDGECYGSLEMLGDLFNFVKWEDNKPTSIKEILDKREVDKNA